MKCRRCDARRFRSTLCRKHYRLAYMGYMSRHRGKRAPSIGALEKLVPNPFDCPVCSRPMIWTCRKLTGRVVTIQHDASGRIRLICMSCNARHAGFVGDKLYRLRDGFKFCSQCKRSRPQSEFYKSARGYFLSACRDCGRTMARQRYQRSNGLQVT